MTQEQEKAIIEKWAINQDNGYDFVFLFATLDNINYWAFMRKSLIGHICGIPRMAIVGENGLPYRLTSEEAHWVFAHS